MIDLFNRQVVVWQMSARIDQMLVNDALTAAQTGVRNIVRSHFVR